MDSRCICTNPTMRKKFRLGFETQPALFNLRNTAEAEMRPCLEKLLLLRHYGSSAMEREYY
jgi:hypothetical protein